MSGFWHRLKTAIVDLGMGWQESADPPDLGAATDQLPANLLSAFGKALAGRYVLAEEVGSGGMALVFRARDVKHDRDVALKILRPELTSKVGRERFLREIKLAARLTHPHILPLHDSGEAAGLLYFVMPFVEGVSLRDRLSEEPRLSVEEALEIARAVAAALDYAHRQQVVHRDIKPENIMILDGVAMVTDFGIGKALSVAGTERLTQTGSAIGTPAYMSPEQMYGEGELDGRSDIYSLGCMLYEMLTVQQLFTGPSPQALLARRATRPLPELDFPDAVPDHVQEAVRAALAEAPDDRPSTSAQLADWLITPMQSEAVRRAPPAPPPPKSEMSIAVLPFTNMSGDPGNEYFSDGITEEIINALAQLKDLRVAARTSAFAFKGETPDIGDVGAKLNVATVLEGSVRVAGTRLRVTAQLINVADGYHLWSERFDREMDDVFDIQDEIATTIANRLEVTIAGRTGELLVKPPTGNLEAYELYLKGRYMWNKRTKDGLEEAEKYFRQAIERHDGYALAYSGLADAYLLLGSYGHLTRQESHVKAKAAAEKAIELDETLAEAHTSRGQVLRSERDWLGEEREYLRAIALNPNYATAHQWYATLLAAFGRHEESVREIQRAQELDPLSHAICTAAGVVLIMARDYAGAIEQFEKALELEPGFLSAQGLREGALTAVGRYDEAIPMMERGIELNPEDGDRRALVGYAYAKSGDETRARELLEQAIALGAGDGAMAVLYAVLGDHDRAIECLERAFDEEVWGFLMFNIRVFPFLDPLRSDPRFQDMVRRMKFPE